MQLKGIFSTRFIFGGLVFALFVALNWQWHAYQKFLSTPINWQLEQPLQIAPGEGLSRLAFKWYQQDIISNAHYLKLYGWLNPQLRHIKVGEYAIEAGETPVSLLTKLTQGNVIQYAVTIVEGTNIYELIQSLKEDDRLRFDLAETPEAIAKQIDPQLEFAEGWLLPETYHFDKGTSALAILQRAYKKMQQVLATEWQNRALMLPYKTPLEALIMASIIEKETGLASERKKIAGVFVRRLQKKMRLQTDPTVIYGIGPSFNGDITYKDLRTATPYNTYVIKGLPPTPIAMPGRAAINAALNPLDGDELYFVATGDGGHYFSSTLAEHNKAVRKYQLKK